MSFDVNPISKTLVFVADGKSPKEGTSILIVDDSKKTVTFISRTEKAMMEKTGIAIPAAEQTAYEGKSKVTLEDPKFYKAFIEIYLRDHYTDRSHYKWFPTKTK